MNVIRQFTKSLLCACVPHGVLLARGPRCRNRQLNIALTFDDGPHPEHTPRLLDGLQEFGLRATFFVIGQNAAKYPDLIRKMASDGHLVANHTYSHSEPRHTTAAKFLEEIARTDDLLMELTGQVSSFVRPPKGELTWGKFQGLWKSGKTVALWNVDPKDYRMTDSTQMADWSRQFRPNDGDIVLMHDNHPHAIKAIQTFASTGLFDEVAPVTLEQWTAPDAFAGRAIQTRNSRTWATKGVPSQQV